ncbi:hypothetical protein [Nocardia sp. NPDC004722]
MSDTEPARPPADPEAWVLTPITQIPQLAEAARRLGHTDRAIRVDRPAPPVVHTPGRVAGQWLLSGEMLTGPGAPRQNAFAEAAARESDMDREEFDR